MRASTLYAMADERGRKPKYRLIADDLRAAMDSGKLAVGDQLPTLPDLAAQYDVAINTIDHALGILRGEGRVQTAHGSGTWVTEPGAEASADFVVVMRRLDEMEAEVKRLREIVEGPGGQ